MAESSDDEFEYDSDEDTVIKIMGKNYHKPSSSSRSNIKEENKALLFWRLDKEESFSDWSIEVTVSERVRDTNKMYHVHRSALAIGPNKSGYFEALFKSDQFKERNNSTSEVRLSEDGAACFPDFLDYLYSPPTECTCIIKRDNWYSLQYLADYFLVPKLTEAISDFVEEDMHNLSHLEKYLSDCCGYDDFIPKVLLAHATRACAKMILSIEAGSSLLTTLSPAMFLHIISMLRSSKDIKSIGTNYQYHICHLAVDYIQNHQSNLDANYFDALVRELYFPNDVKLAGLLAIDLLKIIKLTGWGMGKYGGIEDVCAAALSEYVADIVTNKTFSTEIHAITRQIPNRVVTVLLAEALCAKKALNTRIINNVSCKIMSGTYGVPVGSIMQISIKSTYSISYIKYLIGRHLNFMPSGYDRSIRVFRGSTELEGRLIVSKCGITSDTVLEISNNSQ